MYSVLKEEVHKAVQEEVSAVMSALTTADHKGMFVKTCTCMYRVIVCLFGMT